MQNAVPNVKLVLIANKLDAQEKRQVTTRQGTQVWYLLDIICISAYVYVYMLTHTHTHNVYVCMHMYTHKVSLRIKGRAVRWSPLSQHQNIFINLSATPKAILKK